MVDLRPLHAASFRHLAAAYWVNEFGNWIGEIALAILVFDRTKSALATAGLFLAMSFAPAVLAPLLTVRIEAINPRLVLTTLYLLEAAFFAGLAVVAHHFSLPLVLALAAVDGILAVTSKALTRSAIATNLVKVRMLREGNGLVNLGTQIAAAGSPAIAGVVVAWKGAAPALLIDAATFAVTALIVVTAPGIRIESDIAAGTRGRARAGLAQLRTRPAVRRLMLGLAFALLLSSIAVPVEVVFAKSTLHAGDFGYGLLLSAWGGGMMVGGFAFTAASHFRLVTLLGLGLLAVAIGYGGMAVAPSLAAACPFSAIGGIGNGVAGVALVTAIQERIPLNTQGAMMSMLEGVNQVMPALGFMAGGAITALSSPRFAIAASAVGTAVILLFFSLRPIDRVTLDSLDRRTPGVEPGTGAPRSEAAKRTAAQNAGPLRPRVSFG